MKHLFLFISLGLALVGCAPKVITTATGQASAAPAPEAFLIIKENESFDGPAQELGDINIKDSGFTLSCDYETVVALATAQARQLGANVLRIYEHRAPDIWSSTCHRIRAKALRVADLTPYEREVLWQPMRRLRPADFKASVVNRPFAAATSSSIRYYYAGRPFQRTVQLHIETVFDCRNSYFKSTRDTTSILAHEQGHFDITELYARRLAQTLQTQAPDTKTVQANGEAILHNVMTEAQTLQDQYDTEVYADPTKQPAWLARIAQQLTELQPYASKQVTLKVRL